MTLALCRCNHLASEHDRKTIGRGQCRVLFGSFSDYPTYNEQCRCPSYRPVEEVSV